MTSRTTPEEDEDLRVGDVAIVPYRRLRAQIGCAAEAGILMEDRRNVVLLFFPGTDRSFWLERDKVQAVAADRLPLHPLVERLHRLARQVDAVLIEFYEQTGDEGVFHVYTPSLVFDDLVAIQDIVGDDLRDLRVEAGSVRRVRIRLTFRVPA